MSGLHSMPNFLKRFTWKLEKTLDLTVFFALVRYVRAKAHKHVSEIDQFNSIIYYKSLSYSWYFLHWK
jgi:hypothetical protein